MIRKIFLGMMVLLLMASCGGNRPKDQQLDEQGGIETPVAEDTLKAMPDTILVSQTDTTMDAPATLSTKSKKKRTTNVQEYNQERQTPEFHFKRGLVLYEISKYGEGIKEFDTVISMSPEMTRAYVNRGKGKYQLKQYQGALEDFARAIDIDNTDTTAYNQLALTYYYMGNYPKSVEANTELIKLSPNNASAYFNRGVAYGQLKNYNKSIADFEKAVALNKKYTEAWFNLGLAHYWAGDTSAACEAWGKASSLGSKKAASALGNYCN